MPIKKEDPKESELKKYLKEIGVPLKVTPVKLPDGITAEAIEEWAQKAVADHGRVYQQPISTQELKRLKEKNCIACQDPYDPAFVLPCHPGDAKHTCSKETPGPEEKYTETHLEDIGQRIFLDTKRQLKSHVEIVIKKMKSDALLLRTVSMDACMLAARIDELEGLHKYIRNGMLYRAGTAKKIAEEQTEEEIESGIHNRILKRLAKEKDRKDAQECTKCRKLSGWNSVVVSNKWFCPSCSEVFEAANPEEKKNEKA